MVNVKYSLSGSFDGSQIKFYENSKKTVTNIQGKILKPSGKTVLALGANPSGNAPSDGGFLNGNIYSIRVYNRALTDEEVTYNYAIDKARFNITE